jgi:hypothetical protein
LLLLLLPLVLVVVLAVVLLLCPSRIQASRAAQCLLQQLLLLPHCSLTAL